MSDPMSDPSLSSSPSHAEEMDDEEEVGDGEQDEQYEDGEDDDEDDEQGQSISDMEMREPYLHRQASVEEEEEAELSHLSGEAELPRHKQSSHVNLQCKGSPHDYHEDDDEDDDMDPDPAFLERDDFDSGAELATLPKPGPATATTHHSDTIGAEAGPLASEDLMVDKDEVEARAQAEAGDEAEVEEVDTEPDFLDFLKRPQEDDVGTPEEQMEFVQELERFFAERKMEYKHPKFYGKNVNCLKLWRTVVRLGGYDAVTTGKLWRQVGDTFNPPSSCTTVSWSFRGFYQKALYEYERFKLGGILTDGHDGTGAEAPADAVQPSSSQPSFMPSLGRTRRDAASRAMQGWHSQRLLGNGDVGDSIMKAPSSSKRAKQLKMGLLRKKKGIRFDRAAQGARNKSSRSLLDGGPHQNVEEAEGPPYFSLQKKKSSKQDYANQAWKRSGGNDASNGNNIWVRDEGPEADWVKVNVHKMRDCFEVYALVPGLLRDEVRVQCEPGGQLAIIGEPEERNNPWGITSFKKVINLPLPIDASQTAAVVTVQGQLFVRVPFDLTHS